MWKVEVTSKETIMPSTPTPPHLQTHHLSWLDRVLNDNPIDFILFYSNSNPNSLSTLKTSLSQTLSLFYPFAGRLNHDDTVVHCNDHGIELIEARATADAPLSHLVASSDINTNLHSLNSLLVPCVTQDSSSPLLIIQITTFVSCGGIAIGCSFAHKIADGHSVASFITAWAATACGNTVSRPVFDVAYLFPPPSDSGKKDSMSSVEMNHSTNPVPAVTKRFVFTESTISSLRDQSSVSLTRVQAVIALLWRCCLRAKEMKRRCSVAGIVATMRGRALPEELFGNLFFVAAATMENNEAAVPGFEEKVSKAIKGIDVERLRRFQGRDEWNMVFEPVIEAMTEYGGSDHIDKYVFSSWNQFPFYEADFGWGNPIWVGVAMQQLENSVILTGRGGGSAGGRMEAWVTLEEGEMTRFENDGEITTYASSL